MPREPRLWGAFLVMGCLNNAIPFTLMSWGQIQIDTGPTAIFNAMTAVFAVLVAAAAYLLYYRVLAMAGAGNLLLCTLIIPPIAIVLGVVFLDETLAPRTLAGFALIAAGLAVIDGRLLRWKRLTNH